AARVVGRMTCAAKENGKRQNAASSCGKSACARKGSVRIRRREASPAVTAAMTRRLASIGMKRNRRGFLWSEENVLGWETFIGAEDGGLVKESHGSEAYAEAKILESSRRSGRNNAATLARRIVVRSSCVQQAPSGIAGDQTEWRLTWLT